MDREPEAVRRVIELAATLVYRSLPEVGFGEVVLEAYRRPQAGFGHLELPVFQVRDRFPARRHRELDAVLVGCAPIFGLLFATRAGCQQSHPIFQHAGEVGSSRLRTS